MKSQYFWAVIGLSYLVLTIFTYFISRYCKNYVDEWTEGAGWYKTDRHGNVIEEIGFFQPIIHYLNWMMGIDMCVFVVAMIAAFYSAGIINL